MSRRSPTRRGGAYVAVLVTATAVSLIAVTAMAVRHRQLQVGGREKELIVARTLAVSAAEHALRAVVEASAAGPDWRSTMKSANLDASPVLPLGDGTFQWALLNRGDDRMSSDEEKPIYVLGTGWYGRATQRVRVMIRPAGLPYSSLVVPMYADADITFASGSVLQCAGTIGAGDDVTAASASIFPDVESNGTISGGTYFGTTVTAAPTRGMPGDGRFDYYEQNGTPIDGDLLPGSISQAILTNLVLSPDVNPFGPTNLEGIYTIDCHGRELVISNVRIHGTLFVRNLGANLVVVEQSVYLSPAAVNLPALLVDGKLKLAAAGTDLSEEATGTNFNPPGAAYQGGSDTDTTDTYPSVINGLVFAKSTITVDPPYTRIRGALLGDGSINLSSTAILDLTYDPSVAETPAPGFFVPDGAMQIAAFTWSQPY